MRRQRGFTLVELLVVIVIIGILVGILLPAVQAVRELARRMVCSNNINQMALACLQHESVNEFLPSGGWGWAWAGDPNRGFRGDRQPGGWHFNILPYMDQLNLYNKGLISPYNNQQDLVAGQARARTPVAVFICPSRRKVQMYFRHHGTNYVNINDPQATSPPPSGIGRSDYAANAGDNYAFPTEDADPGYSETFDWSTVPGTVNSNASQGGPATGVIFCASMTAMAQIKAGPANTYLLGERYLNPDAYYTGSECDDDQGWDQGYDFDTDRWTTYPPHRDTSGYLDNGGCNTIFGSAHPTGFQMAFCDGSVHLISFTINLTLHKQLGNRTDIGYSQTRDLTPLGL